MISEDEGMKLFWSLCQKDKIYVWASKRAGKPIKSEEMCKECADKCIRIMEAKR